MGKEKEKGAMPVRRYVQVGRVALVQRGPLADTLVVIVDIVDQNRALVDWSVDGGEYFERQMIGLKMLNLTDITLDIERTPKKKALAAAIKAADVEEKIASRKSKLATNDFDRYKAMVKKIKTNSKIRAT